MSFICHSQKINKKHDLEQQKVTSYYKTIKKLLINNCYNVVCFVILNFQIWCIVHCFAYFIANTLILGMMMMLLTYKLG